jgi:hypothetical protein
MRGSVRTAATALLTAAGAAVSLAQTPAPAENQGSRMLVVYREEVRAGKGAAHKANENAWANAYRKAGLPAGWVGATTMTGPNEAWFFTPVNTLEEFEKLNQAQDAHPTYAPESAKLSEKDGEYLNRTSTLLLRRRPGISYQPDVKVADMRYLQVDIVRVKPGRVSDFMDAWREVVAAHEKAKMDEHWVVHQVISGMPDGTFIFFYPVKSMAAFDKAEPMHAADAYRGAMGEGGRRRMRDMSEAAMEWSQSIILALEPQMSAAPQEWASDPFWVLKPAAPAKTK